MLPLEKALFHIRRSDRNAIIVARHYGYDGRGGANFQRIGDEYGLCRERVRQIVSESDPQEVILPAGSVELDRVIAFVAASLPASAAEIEKKVQQAGLTTRAFRIEGIVSAAGILRRPVPFRVSIFNKTRFVLPESSERFCALVSRAREQVRRHGMAQVSEFSMEDNGAAARRGGSRLVEVILSSETDFRWLDQSTGWFWLTDTPRNRAVSRVRKMLAVANPLSMSELGAGLSRMGTLLPPDRALQMFYSQIPGLSVKGDFIHANPGIDTSVLNQTERDIYELLLEHGGCISNSELISQSRVFGIKRPTFYQCVNSSPILARYKGRGYRLIGTPVQTWLSARTAAATV